jgi:hypothetical protein
MRFGPRKSGVDTFCNAFSLRALQEMHGPNKVFYMVEMQL